MASALEVVVMMGDLAGMLCFRIGHGERRLASLTGFSKAYSEARERSQVLQWRIHQWLRSASPCWWFMVVIEIAVIGCRHSSSARIKLEERAGQECDAQTM